MGNTSQFHDGAQLRSYPHLAQSYYTSGLGSRNLCQGLGAPLWNSTNFVKLTLSQYGKAFGLSATPVAY